jgi:phosphatidylglycerol:prolipoprotein diacylglycerol transferase
MLVAPCPSAFTVFGFEIKYYGITLAIAILTGVCASYFIAKKYYKQVSAEALFDLFPILIICGILVSRLYYVGLNFEYYQHFPEEILMLRKGGLTIHGAVLGGFLGGFIYCRWKKLPVLTYADIIAFGLILAQAIGRWGNFFNSEAFGRPVDLPLLYIAPAFRPLEFAHSEYFHPTFLYESILNVLIFLLLFFVVRKLAKHKAGVVFFSYLLLYSIARIFVEQLRIDSVLDLAGMPVAQVVSVFLAVVSIVALVIIGRRQNDRC